jgi:hypothetical protein
VIDLPRRRAGGHYSSSQATQQVRDPAAAGGARRVRGLAATDRLATVVVRAATVLSIQAEAILCWLPQLPQLGGCWPRLQQRPITARHHRLIER